MDQQTVPRGIYAAMVTPFDDGLRIDAGALKAQVAFLSGTQIDGFFACASTGEFMNLPFEENVRALDIIAKANAGEKTLICGACATNVADALRYIDEAAARGYAAAVACPPYYVKMNDDELIAYYRTLAANSAKLPVMLYNVPLFTTPLRLGVITALMDDPRIAGIKDSSSAFKQIAHTLQMRPNDGFRVFCGTDDVFLPALAAGCDGIMTALAGVLPEPMLRIRALFEAGKMDEARRVQQSILPLVRLADSMEFPLGYKLIAAARGLPIGKWYQNVDAASVVDTIERMRPLLARMLGDGMVIY